VAQRGHTKTIYKLLAVIQLALLAITGCGDAGVSNGSIRGTVYSNRSGGAASKTPEPGVAVMAQFEGEPPINRVDVSDSNGQYVITGLPVGRYVMGFQKDGFNTITTEEGNSKEQTALGNQIRLWLGSGSTVTAPDVTLTEKPATGDGTVIITLIDSKTGEYIDNATVTAGTGTTSNSSNGQYQITVAVSVSGDNSIPDGINVSVNAEGYDPLQKEIQAFAGQVVAYTMKLDPELGTLEGRITFSRFESLYSMDDISITVDGIQGVEHPEASGDFKIEVPVRTNSNNRRYVMRVNGKGIEDQVINNIVGPVAGAIRVDVPALVPITTTVLGQVINPNVAFPAVVEGTGLEGGISGGVANCPSGTQGSFAIDGVPVYTATELNISATVYSFDKENCAAGFETSTASLANGFIAVNNSEGVYRVGTIGAGGS
jgi:hypothetical protein